MRLPHACLLFTAVGLAVIAGCGAEFTTNNPTSSSTTGTGGGATTTSGTGGSASGTGGSSTTGTGGGTTTATGTGGSTTGTGGSMTGTGGGTTTTTGAGGSPGECTSDADCDTLYGKSKCGGRACLMGVCGLDSPGCADADHDGFGAGQGCMCAGIDCDDNDASVKSTKSCYGGPPNTEGVGVCRAGTITCLPAGPTACDGEIVPTGEACNNEDDDCDGVVDDGLGKLTCGVGACETSIAACSNGVIQSCVPLSPQSAADACDGADNNCNGAVDEDCLANCVYVSKLGNDLTANGALGLPFATVQAAINFAAQSMNGGTPRQVCVTAGIDCNATGTYPGSFTMADGVSVYGNYNATSGSRCSSNTPAATVIQVKTAEGVIFPSNISEATVLDGFRIDRAAGNVSKGVTIDGAKGAVVSNTTIPALLNIGVQTNTYGVVVQNGAVATIGPKNRIEAGNGTTEAIGVRVQSSKVTIQDNCQAYDNKGRCNDFCALNPSIKGGFASSTLDSYAILLTDSPGSLVETSAICGNSGVHGATVKITGDADGTVLRANRINAFGGTVDSHGVWMEDCQDSAPWLFDNTAIAAQGANAGTLVDGVRAVGKCHAVVDQNVSIGGGGEGQASKPSGVHCLAKGGHPSECLISGNALIYGSTSGVPPEATGVRCEGKSCVRIVRNFISGRGGQVSYGVYLDGSGAFIDSNIIGGGCSPTATGLEAQDGYARVQNNILYGYSSTDCQPGINVMPVESRGVHLLTFAGPNEMEIHSNTIDAAGSPQAACTSYGIKLDAAVQAPPAGSGIFRNNIINPGFCQSKRYNFAEGSPSADPRLFENNDLNPAIIAPSALYFDEGNVGLTMASQVDNLTVTAASGTLSTDPLFVQYPQNIDLQAGSPCAGKGTNKNAPSKDITGKNRPNPPAIGAYEP